MDAAVAPRPLSAHFSISYLSKKFGTQMGPRSSGPWKSDSHFRESECKKVVKISVATYDVPYPSSLGFLFDL